MAVYINDECTLCAACMDECPNGAIVDESKNPTGEELYYVYEDKCDECGGSPACVEVCPADCIHVKE